MTADEKLECLGWTRNPYTLNVEELITYVRESQVARGVPFNKTLMFWQHPKKSQIVELDGVKGVDMNLLLVITEKCEELGWLG